MVEELWGGPWGHACRVVVGEQTAFFPGLLSVRWPSKNAHTAKTVTRLYFFSCQFDFEQAFSFLQEKVLFWALG